MFANALPMMAPSAPDFAKSSAAHTTNFHAFTTEDFTVPFFLHPTALHDTLVEETSIPRKSVCIVGRDMAFEISLTRNISADMEFVFDWWTDLSPEDRLPCETAQEQENHFEDAPNNFAS